MKARLKVEDVPSAPPTPTLVTGPDGATLSKTAMLSSVVRTSKGFAVAYAEIAPDGSVKSIRLGYSQTAPEFIAREHKRTLGVP